MSCSFDVQMSYFIENNIFSSKSSDLGHPDGMISGTGNGDIQCHVNPFNLPHEHKCHSLWYQIKVTFSPFPDTDEGFCNWAKMLENTLNRSSGYWPVWHICKRLIIWSTSERGTSSNLSGGHWCFIPPFFGGEVLDQNKLEVWSF